jgi:hypothetical protein
MDKELLIQPTSQESTENGSIRVLGEGGYGLVLTKPLQCNATLRNSASRSGNRGRRTTSRNTPRRNKVAVKLSFKEDMLVREYEFMKSLPQGKQYPYAQIDQISLCTVALNQRTQRRLKRLVKKGKIHEEWHKKSLDKSNTLYQLTMPRIGTHSLYEELQKYRHPTSKCGIYDTTTDENKKKPFISKSRALMLFDECRKMFEVITQLNKRNMYHFDISMPNIMCDFRKTPSLYLIDFGLSFSADGSKLVKSEMTARNYSEYIYKDVSRFMEDIVLYILLSVCSRKSGYDIFFHYLKDIKTFVYDVSHHNVSHIDDVHATASQYITDICNDMQSYQPNNDDTYIDVHVDDYKVKLTVTQQRKAARENFLPTIERSQMGKHDKK